MTNGFAAARERYKPDRIKCILVAESPPKLGSNRFFYFKNVTSRDGLFIETMRVLYSGEYDFSDVQSMRAQKRQLLEKFRDDGFYLIDSTDEPIAGLPSSEKRARIRAALPSLQEKLHELADGSTPITLIAATVYAVCNNSLRAEGFNIINDGSIPLPVMGHQREFRLRLARALGLPPLPDDPVRYLHGILKDKPSMTQALLEERARDLEHE